MQSQARLAALWLGGMLVLWYTEPEYTPMQIVLVSQLLVPYAMQVLDQHAEQVMYQTALVADSPDWTDSQAHPAMTSNGCAISLASAGLSAASAALSVLQSAAAAGVTSSQLLLPPDSSSGNSAAGCPGMLKSWAAETGASVVIEQQEQTHSKAVLGLTTAAGGKQAAFTEQEARWVLAAM